MAITTIHQLTITLPLPQQTAPAPSAIYQQSQLINSLPTHSQQLPTITLPLRHQTAPAPPAIYQ